MLNQKLQTVSINNLDYVPIASEKMLCPKCLVTEVKKPSTGWIGKCNTCKNSYIIFWKPFPSQQIILALLRLKRTTPVWIYNFGAMNTGKTDIDCFAAVQFALEHPGTTQAFLARDFQMIKRVIPDSLDPFIHTDWLAKKDGKFRKSIDTGYYFENGSRFLFLPSDDDKKVRSLNTSRWILIEGEDINLDLVHALSGRLRQDEGVSYAREQNGDYVIEEVYDSLGRVKKRRKMGQSYYAIVVEANPDPNSYVYTEGLLESKQIFHTTSVRGLKEYAEVKTKTNDYKYSVISATPDSPYVKEGYIEEKLQTWTEDEIRANLFGEFVANDNLVYPGATNNFINEGDFTPNPNWPHWISIDPGVGKDPCAMLMKCYDPDHDRMVYYKESYEYGMNLRQMADILRDWCYETNVLDIIIDPSSKATRQLVNNTSTKIELEGILRRPLIDGINNIDDGITLVKSRINEQKIFFTSNLTSLYTEFTRYSYEKGKNKPKMGWDHLMDALRYNEQRTRSDAGYDIINQYKTASLLGTIPKKTTPTMPWILEPFKSKPVEQEQYNNFVEMEDFGHDW